MTDTITKMQQAADAVESVTQQGLSGDDLHAAYGDAFNAFAGVVEEFCRSVAADGVSVSMVQTHGWDSHYITVRNDETFDSVEIRVANHPNNHGESDCEIRFDLPKFWPQDLEAIRETIEAL